MSASADRDLLRRAALGALRAAGDAEPNPLVGCILTDAHGAVIGLGHHRRFGGPHAEIEALRDAARRGIDTAGATAHVTLEPCQGTGKTGPCTDALVRAGVKRVVVAASDPHPKGAGGAEALRRAGVEVRFTDASPFATWLSAPHRKRTTQGMPWVIAKWAETADGRIHSVPGAERWISCPQSLRRVHRLRARVDMIITGIGTVLADDPLLTARDIPRLRRVARRVVLDPSLRTPPTSKLVRSVQLAPLTIVGEASKHAPQAEALRRAGAEVLDCPTDAPGALRALRGAYAPATIMLESGPKLLQAFLRAGLVDEAWVFIAPGPRENETPALIDPAKHTLLVRRRSGVDSMLVYGATGWLGASSSGHAPV